MNEQEIYEIIDKMAYTEFVVLGVMENLDDNPITFMAIWVMN